METFRYLKDVRKLYLIPLNNEVETYYYYKLKVNLKNHFLIASKALRIDALSFPDPSGYGHPPLTIPVINSPVGQWKCRRLLR